jgi:hypothetical protein
VVGPARARAVSARLAAALAFAFGSAGTASAQMQDCTAALVLALDVSASVDEVEYRIQMDGLAAAFRDEAVVQTILAYPGAGIMATAFLWSGFQHQESVTGWTWLGDETAIAAFADRIEQMPRTHDYWPTALGRAIAHSADLHDENGMPCRRRIVDVSGDGVNNDGQPPRWYAAQGRFAGLTINGLVIRGAVPDPTSHYEREVLHGPGAFLEVAESFEDYPAAILRKLLRELQPMLGDNRQTGR